MFYKHKKDSHQISYQKKKIMRRTQKRDPSIFTNVQTRKGIQDIRDEAHEVLAGLFFSFFNLNQTVGAGTVLAQDRD